MAFSQVVRHSFNNRTIIVRHAKERDMDDFSMMPDFFEKDFSVETTTGFIRVWDGSYVTLQYLKEHSEALGITKGANVIELGSGVGLLGICMATMGANVLLTDVKSSVDCITSHNVELNVAGRPLTDLPEPSAKDSAPASSPTLSTAPKVGFTPTPVTDFFVKAAKAYAIGDGVAGSYPLDWVQPLSQGIIDSLQACDRIVACDCVFIPSLAEMCGKVIAQMLKHCRKGTKALLVFSHRDTTVFTRREQLVAAFTAAGLAMDWLETIPANPALGRETWDVSMIDVTLAEE